MLERSPTVLQVSVCIISAVSHPLLRLPSSALWIKTASLYSKEKSGCRIRPHIIPLTRLISHLKFLPCREVPVEQRWQPELFLFLPGFLDKNNDLLFRNLKEVSVDRGRFQYSAERGVGFKMGWHMREKILLDSTWRMRVHRAALWKDKFEVPEVHLTIKKQNKTKKPKQTVLSHVSLIVLWRILCTLSLKTSLSADHVQLRESYHKSVFWQDRADRQKETWNGKSARAGWKWGCFLFFKRHVF